MPRRVFTSMFAPRATPPSSFIVIDLLSTDDEGRELPGRTWTWGFGTPTAVLGRWRRAHPTLAAHESGTTVVTRGPKKVVYDGLAPLGPRVEVRDEALLKVAVGL